MIAASRGIGRPGGGGRPDIALGCAQLGDLYRALADDEATAIVDAAWDVGIRHFDTAPHYGAGLSEWRVGRALRGRDRDDYTISTKVGRRLESPTGGSTAERPHPDTQRVIDYTADGIRRTLDDSRARLGTDRIDIVFVHDPQLDPEAALTTGFAALQAMKDEGAITSIGVGTSHVDLLLRFVRETQIDTVLLSGRMTLLNQEAAAELLPECAARGIRVLNAAVFNSGILATDTVPVDAKYDYRPAPAELLERARRIGDVCADHGVRLPSAALRYSLAAEAVAAVIVGADTPEQIVETVRLLDEHVPPALWDDLDRRSLVPSPNRSVHSGGIS
ncbi:aldo/keto reductase [Agromyces ramosus]|uniref:D-threo-aldose 1-dehydrogenase n=1 Tax=Agromyces ramosus TaxID=33879 RepID=A0ABU0RAP8_9MICO|nr:aldo/keto reductase [Agromyces ramosus]MDQ0895146.1 D-threo-aldose 1-dehydrogenase [Agromyces ramosus]